MRLWQIVTVACSARSNSAIGLPTMLGPPHHHGPRAEELDLVLAEDLHDPGRRRRDEGRCPLEQVAGAERMEAVDVLDRRDGADDAVLVDLLGERQLAEDPGYALVRVELGDEPEKLLLGRLGRELVVERLDPDLAARFLLPFDVDLRRRVLADEDRGEADRMREPGDVLRDLRAYPLGERFAVHEDSHGAKR